MINKFDECIVHGELGQREKADVWQTAIGLQDVDGLKVSPYLLDTARQHSEGYSGLPGLLRKVELSKKEWVLGGQASVSYHSPKYQRGYFKVSN